MSSKYFRPSYCVPEDLNYMEWNEFLIDSDSVKKVEPENLKFSFPIVCFTDLPRQIRRRHKSQYGNYLIEMTEDWKLVNNLQPVWYLCGNDSSLHGEDNRVCSSFLPIVLKLARLKAEELNNSSAQKGLIRHYDNFLNLLIPYFKIYQSEDKSTRFYDEREWRYLATGISGEKMTPISLCLTEDVSEEKRSEANNILWSDRNNMLHFTWEDVVCIEVTNKDEKKQLASLIKTEYGISIYEANKKIKIVSC